MPIYKKSAVTQPDYTEEEQEYRSQLIREMTYARDQREQNHDEFDGMTYTEWWESNIKAAAGYIPPKKNEQDVAIVTGTTKEKKNSLLSNILNFDFNSDIEAFDKDDRLILELGATMEDFIHKSRELERPIYEEKKPLIYGELLDQGTDFVEESWKEFALSNRDLDKFDWQSGVDMKATWKERIDTVYRFCDASPISGLNVYLGNIRQFHIELQPYVIIRRLRSREEAEAMYGNWERWENVPYDLVRGSSDMQDADSVPFHYWSLEPLEKNQVEEVKYFNLWSNNFMIMLNGVMMFPVRKEKDQCRTFPLTAINGQHKYPIAKGDIEPISPHFAYSKSIPAKTKVIQQVFDEMLRGIVLSDRLYRQPPMANNTGRPLSKNIFYPATIHNGIDAAKLQPIGGERAGVSNSQLSAAQFVKEIIDGQSVTPIFEGQQGRGNQTAREVIELKRQSMLKVGLAILGIINLERQLSELRLNNILMHWMDEDPKISGLKSNIITVQSKFENGEEGERIIELTNEIPASEQIMAEEELLGRVRGKKIRKTVLSPKQVRKMARYWKITVTPVEKSTNELNKVLFKEYLADVLNLSQLTGRQVNVEHLLDRHAILNGEDPEKIWLQSPGMPMGMQQGMMQGMAQGMPGQQMPQGQVQQQMMPRQTQRPSINTLA